MSTPVECPAAKIEADCALYGIGVPPYKNMLCAAYMVSCFAICALNLLPAHLTHNFVVCAACQRCPFARGKVSANRTRCIPRAGYTRGVNGLPTPCPAGTAKGEQWCATSTRPAYFIEPWHTRQYLSGCTRCGAFAVAA